jgi:GPI mannosyltransferase 3
MYGEGLPEKKRLFFAGLFCGLAVSLRIQLAPAVAFAVFCFCRGGWRRKGPALLAGLLLPVAAFGLLDAITWSYPFQSFLLYLWVNLVEGRSLMFGTLPWYWYLLLLARSFGPLLLLALVGVRRSPFLGWVTFIVVSSHSLLAHKEPRFMYPVMPIVITLAALGFVELAAAWNTWRKPTLSTRAIVIAGLMFFALTSGFLAWRFPRWRQSSGGLIAMDRLSQDSSLCGVGLPPLLWLRTGGYAHLHQNVPIILIDPNIALEEQAPSFNALLTLRRFTDQKIGFKSAGCWNGVCLYRRAGSCIVSSQDNEVNKMLRESGN